MEDRRDDRRSFLKESILRTAIVAGVGWASPQTLRGGDPESAEGRLPSGAATLELMSPVIFDAVQRRDTSHPVFHGCIDWHSAVHAHWALLRIAAASGQRGESFRWVVSSLDAKRLVLEDEDLRRRPSFEMPYGRAWFLRLAIEFEQSAGAVDWPGAKPLATMANNVASSLLKYCRSRPLSPATREYGNHSWALAQLFAFYKHRSEKQRQKEAAALVRQFFLNVNSDVDFHVDHHQPDFFSLYGNWLYLICLTQNRDAARHFYKSRRPTGDALRTVTPQLNRAHHLGVNWSRAWALRAASRIVDDGDERERLTAAYDAHVAAGLAAYAQHQGDYGAYGHWVPQFAVYATT